MGAVASYVNMGDTYVATILYDIEKGEFFVTSWGDWVEEYERENEPLEGVRSRKGGRGILSGIVKG